MLKRELMLENWACVNDLKVLKSSTAKKLLTRQTRVEDQFVLMAGNHELLYYRRLRVKEQVALAPWNYTSSTTKQFNHGSKERKLANQQISTLLTQDRAHLL